jgi:hypothetical protein
MTFDLTLTDRTGAVVASVEEFRIALVPPGGAAGAQEAVPGSAIRYEDVYGVDTTRYLLAPDDALSLLDAVLRQEESDHVVLSLASLDDRARFEDLTDRSVAVEDPVEHSELDAGLTETEAAVARMWRVALGQRRVLLDDDFFSLGGNSLVVVQLLSRMRREFGATLPGRALVDNPTVRTLAAAIDEIRALEPELATTATH